MSAQQPDDKPAVLYRNMRARVLGDLAIFQAYYLNTAIGQCLLVNLKTGGVTLCEEIQQLDKDYLSVYGILGVLHLTAGAAVAVITAADKVAKLCGAEVHRVTGTQVLTAADSKPSVEDARLIALLGQAIGPSAAGRGLYFAYERNLTLSQQRLSKAMERSAGAQLWQHSSQDFWWNEALSRPLCAAGAHAFVLPCILGFVRQIADAELRAGLEHDTVTVTLVARRCPRRAGTRHWRRGADLCGDAANLVETEQVMETASGHLAAFVQLRGSIPLCWSQVPNTKYKPPTVIADGRDVNGAAFARHAERLAAAYGDTVCVNLVNQHGSEGRLAAEFERLAMTLPQQPGAALRVVSFDFHKECGSTNYGNLSKLWDQLMPDFNHHSMFQRLPSGEVRRSQVGVFRTNCIDCLDRTNVVQGLLARKAMEAVLQGLSLLGAHATLDTGFPALERRFKIMWADHGDMISRQYAGTGALKSGFTRTGRRTAAGLLDDGLKSAVRYFLNNYEDGRKQDAIDLVVGNFSPSREGRALVHKQASGALPVLLSVVALLLGLQLLLASPFSSHVTLLTHVLPLFVTAAALVAAVAVLGQRATCRPQLCPGQTQPWVGGALHGKTA